MSQCIFIRVAADGESVPCARPGSPYCDKHKFVDAPVSVKQKQGGSCTWCAQAAKTYECSRSVFPIAFCTECAEALGVALDTNGFNHGISRAITILRERLTCDEEPGRSIVLAMTGAKRGVPPMETK